MSTHTPRTLILGAGMSPQRNLRLTGDPEDFINPVTLDVMPGTEPDVLHDLNDPYLPFPDSAFTEIHAYEILEHVGRQGDFHFFFTQFHEFHRVLAPNGRMYITTPAPTSIWAWGDPGHTRVLPYTVFHFLTEEFYTNNREQKTAASHYAPLVAPRWWKILIARATYHTTSIVLSTRTPANPEASGRVDN